MNSEWIFENGKYPVCQNCKYILKAKYATPYCPFCGRYMVNYLEQEQEHDSLKERLYKVY